MLDRGTILEGEAPSGDQLARLRALQAALDAGYPIHRELRSLRTSLAPSSRHQSWKFLRFFLLSVFSLTTQLTIYLGFFEDLLSHQWGAPDHWYLRRFRPGSAWVWKSLSEITASPFLVGCTVALLYGSLWIVQSRLPARQAGLLMTACGVFTFILVMFVYLSLFNLMMLPLG
jgi:hypothetical protein